LEKLEKPGSTVICVFAMLIADFVKKKKKRKKNLADLSKINTFIAF
jgi:hypothetical protein